MGIMTRYGVYYRKENIVAVRKPLENVFFASYQSTSPIHYLTSAHTFPSPHSDL